MAFTLNPVKRHRDRCRQVRAQMSEYLDGELDERDVRALERHVRFCPDCRRMLASLRGTIAALRNLGHRPEEADASGPPA